MVVLQLKGALQEKSSVDLQIRLPILVVGGGLTAVDTATEALAYYEFQVEKFLRQTEAAGGLSPTLSEEETEIAQEFLNHAQRLRQGDRSFLENASTIVYRKILQESPSYGLNHKELQFAMAEGVVFLENAIPLDIQVDAYDHVKNLMVQTPTGVKSLPCRTLLISTGTYPHKILEQEAPDLTMVGQGILLSYKGENRVSFFGDLHPVYEGNVVKAMASAKDGYPIICETLLGRPPVAKNMLFESLNRFSPPTSAQGLP